MGGPGTVEENGAVDNV